MGTCKQSIMLASGVISSTAMGTVTAWGNFYWSCQCILAVSVYITIAVRNAFENQATSPTAKAAMS
jgi:hypothetical protein